jgi:hypothetical protein
MGGWDRFHPPGPLLPVIRVVDRGWPGHPLAGSRSDKKLRLPRSASNALHNFARESTRTAPSHQNSNTVLDSR